MFSKINTYVKVFFVAILYVCGTSCYATKLVNINNTNKGQRTQVISFKFDTTYPVPKIFTTNNDLVLDFASVENNLGKNKIDMHGNMINNIGIFSSSTKLRVVILGGGNYKYDIISKTNTLDLVISNKLSDTKITSSKIGLVETNLNNATTLINNVKFSRDDSNGGLIELNYSGDGQISVEDNRVGNSLQISLLGSNIDASQIKKLDVSDFATPIKFIDTNKYRKGVKLVINNNDIPWDYAIYQLQGKIVINVRSLALNNADASKVNNTKINKVSLNFQNIDVRALLQLMSDFSGYNILISDGVKGAMSLKLNEVPWNQALTIILSAKGLGMRQEGNVIRVAPLAEIADLDKQQLDTKTAQEAVETLETITLRLKYTQAPIVQGMLQKPFGFDDKTNKATSPLSARGSVLVDVRTNTLIINDVPSRIQEIRALIDKIDIPVKMVLIEARIVEANSDFERSLGTRLLLSGIVGGLTYSNTLENAVNINQNGINTLSSNSNSSTGGGTSSGSSSGSSTGSTSGSTGSANTNFGTATTSSLAMIFSPNSNNLIGLEIDALEAQNGGKTISSPKVMTANYQVASIQQGVQIPYQQATSAGNTSIAFINAVLSLKVTPQITDDGNILLSVDIHKDTPNTKLVVQGTPSIDTNSVTTSVQVLDGSTILVGGVYIDNQQHVEAKIPWLGDIPYLGWLFKSVYDANNKKELLIFITPKIISNTLNDDNN